ncbi:MAG: glycine--tRNA ligase subunit beta [Coriobacteriales bacterium]|jgi:glycyl-tRNA synthetase beta chain|nr:glycine--tRNA ligase subunit beta [Coriobacteriales bacterium]
MPNNNLVFEIGTEEIPAMPLYKATEQLCELAKAAFKEARIEHGCITTCSTPRRIILRVQDVAPTSTALSMRSRGPAVKIAYDADGNPTKAAQGFARGKGVSIEDLTRGMDGETEYVYAEVNEPAEQTAELLAPMLASMIVSIDWPRSQRWGSGDATFSRPVRWLLALLGSDIIPVQFAGLTAGRATWGHRLMANKAVDVACANELASTHDSLSIIESAEDRANVISQQIGDIEAQSGLSARVPKAVLKEVVNLVEYPTVLMGTFDEEFLEVPPEIITDAMLKHQRYFPMYEGGEDGKLSNHFIVVSNGDPKYNDQIIAGHERVVRPRLDDAAFFYNEDLKRPLESYVDDLKQVVFQDKLGTVYDKAVRIKGLAATLAKLAGGSDDQIERASRAAWLAKADLVTSAVVEFTSLQGVMGSYYAAAAGEPAEVASAVREHYQPRFSGDAVPDGFESRIVAVADKLDTICGIFAADMEPTGSSDPFALRRAAIGVVNILLAGLPLSLKDAISQAVSMLGDIASDADALIAQVRKFFITRIEVMAKDDGYRSDTIDAVLATGVMEPADIMARLAALKEARDTQPQLFEDLATAYARANNLRDAALGTGADEGLFGDAETGLAKAIAAAERQVDSALAESDYKTALAALAALRDPIDRFFEDVLIMDEDKALRDNRLRLLNGFVSVFKNVADFAKLAG